MGKKVLLVILLVFSFIFPAQAAETINYGDAESFEAALNRGENLEGKIVQFEVLEFHPQSALGYNLWAGEHLNFVSERHPNAQQGDILIVKADTIRNNIGSWVINYTEVDDAVADSSTIYNTQESNSAQADTPPASTHALPNQATEIYQPTGLGESSGDVPIWIPAIENMTLTGEYAYPGAYQSRFNYVLFFRNDTGSDAKFIVRATARDASGNILGVSDDSYVFVSSGYEVPVLCNFSNLDYYNVVGINYAMTEDINLDWKSAQSVLSYQTSDTGDKIIMTVTNNGDRDVQQVCGYIFYFNGDKMVDNGRIYFSNASKLSPGVPYTEEIKKPTNVTYDNVKVYVTGIFA